MKDWYLRQSPRDRIIVLIIGLLCLAGGSYAFIWDPLKQGLNDRRMRVQGLQEDYQYVVSGAEQLKAGGSAPESQLRTSDKAPYLLIDEIIRKANIALPQRVEPTGNDGARVQFSEVNFDKLVKVIAELELYGLSVSTLNISNKDQPGIVSARFTMGRS